MATAPISLRINEQVKEDLDRLAKRFGTTPATLGADYLTQGVRTAQHPAIEFRQTPAGRMAYIRGVRLSVWLAVQTVEECGGSVEKAAKLLRLAPLLLHSALTYANAYPKEIEADREAGKAPLDDLERLVPNHSFVRV